MTSCHFLRFTFWAIFILVVNTAIVPAKGDTRVALVIGNSEYRHIAYLNNPQNDARLLAETLTGLGFKLVGNGPQLNLNKSQFDQAVQDFANEIQNADVALFYYAGHGVQVRGANYLVPVGANPTREVDVDFQMLDINLVLRGMEYGRARLNLVILDACRNNPFGVRGLRAASAGLAQMQAPEGTLISFATQPGNVAQDGSEGNSPFSKALAQTIRTPGLDIFRAFNEVGLIVSRATGGEQQPWVSLSPIKGDFYFAEIPKKETDPLIEQARHFEAAARVDTTDAWDSFLKLHKSGYYADLARAQRAKVVAAQQAKAKAEAEARAKAEAEARAQAEATERQRREAEVKAARDAALKAAGESTAAEKAKREAEARAAQTELEKAERETAAARQAQEAAKAAQLEAERTVHELQQALERARQEAAAQAKKQVELAALSSGPALPSVLRTTDVVRLLKYQLRQAGCDPGNDTGVWDESSRRAIERFNKYAGTRLDVNAPNLEALSAIRTKSGRICPLVCSAGTRIEGDRCVAIKPKSEEKRAVTPPSSDQSASAGGAAAADLLYRCRSKDRAACETLCKAGFDRPCRAANSPFMR